MADRWQSWGRYPGARQSVLRVRNRFAPLPAISGHALPRGNGRSYGDVCLDDGGTLLDVRGLDRFMAFDPVTGVLRVEAGVLLDSILAILAPRGWFLSVVPGTRFVTVGGAIANDVHGKNHHVTGSFGCHVRSLELLRTDGSRRVCSREENSDWFAATIGGLGLTGVVTWAELQLQPVTSMWVDTETIRYECVDDFFTLSEKSADDFEYTVAWVDCRRRGASLGRGIFSRANHAQMHSDVRGPRAPRLRVPMTPPVSTFNAVTVRAFNSLHYHRAGKAWRRARESCWSWLFPLDAIGQWNRLYGPHGFLQYQCVLPPHAASDGVREVLENVATSGQGSCLSVLKQFGTQKSPGLLSFPRPGTTLALDFANRGHATLKLLDRLDAIVAAAGGAVYPAKDARMAGDRFRAYFPHWQSLTPYIDPTFSSGFWRRVTQ